MERRMLLAVVLSFAAVMAWSMFMAPRPKPATENPADVPGDTLPKDTLPKDAEASEGVPPVEPAAPVDPNGEPANPVPAADEPHPQASAPIEKATLANGTLEATFTSQGAGIESITLLGAVERTTQKGLDLVVPLDPTMLMGQMDDTLLQPRAAPGGSGRTEDPAGPMRTLAWTRNTEAEKTTPESDVVYEFKDPSGVLWRKRWVLPTASARYDVSLLVSAKRLQGTGPDKARIKLLGVGGLLREPAQGAMPTPGTVVAMRQRDGDGQQGDELVFGMPFTDVPQDGLPNRMRYLGVRTDYFLAAIYNDTVNGRVSPIAGMWATGEEAARRNNMQAAAVKWFETERGRKAGTDDTLAARIEAGVEQTLYAWALLDVPIAPATGTEATTTEVRWYVGPIDRQQLASDEYAPLSPVLTYPMAPDIITRFLLWIYDLWRGLFGSAGLAVILMTLTVRGGLMPISIRNQLGMRAYGRKVAKVKPKLQALQAKYANNPRKLRDEQMKLYKEHGIGFPGGCLMMLIQIPIFFALFSGLRVEYTIWGESFLWIKDLAGPDRLIPFGKPLIDLVLFRFDAINLLPILMVVISVFHYRSMPKPADEQQAQQMRMMKWLPIFFAFLLYNYTAALALYMVFSSGIALLESRIVRTKDAAREAAV